MLFSSDFSEWWNVQSSCPKTKIRKIMTKKTQQSSLHWKTQDFCSLGSEKNPLSCKFSLSTNRGSVCVFATSALGPMKRSPSRAPAITRTCLGRPTLSDAHRGRQSQNTKIAPYSSKYNWRPSWTKMGIKRHKTIMWLQRDSILALTSWGSSI